MRGDAPPAPRPSGYRPHQDKGNGGMQMVDRAVRFASALALVAATLVVGGRPAGALVPPGPTSSTRDNRGTEF